MASQLRPRGFTDVAGWRWQLLLLLPLPLGRRPPLLQPFAGNSRIAWRDRRFAVVWRQLELLLEAPVASRDASTTLPGYLTLLNR
jgi:hypothetical protein